jgi:hypothetical protein
MVFPNPNTKYRSKEGISTPKYLILLYGRFFHTQITNRLLPTSSPPDMD